VPDGLKSGELVEWRRYETLCGVVCSVAENYTRDSVCNKYIGTCVLLCPAVSPPVPPKHRYCRDDSSRQGTGKLEGWTIGDDSTNIEIIHIKHGW
jgi:hypothetical protein